MISQQEMLSTRRVLVIGAGLTGSLTAALLRREFKQKLHITVWEKSRGAGGRMATNRQPGIPSSVDLGAQYISATTELLNLHKGFYQELLSSSVLVPFEGIIEGDWGRQDVRHFVAPGGMNTVAKHFLHSAEASVHYETQCNSLNIVPATADGSQVWQATDLKDNSAIFDTVIVTIPVPQLLRLEGSIQCAVDSKRALLENVQYSSRYALALYFALGTNIDVPWTAKYIQGDSCVRFICVDSKKRAKDSNKFGPSLLIHTSAPFGIQHLHMDTKQVEKIIISHVRNLLPDLPQHSGSRCHRWRFSQVSATVDGTPGCVVLSESPLLVACGDAFVQHSNFDGCVESALSSLETFSKVKDCNE